MNTPSAQVSVIVRDKIMEEVYFRTREVAGQGQTHRLMMAGVRDRVMLLGRISMLMNMQNDKVKYLVDTHPGDRVYLFGSVAVREVMVKRLLAGMKGNDGVREIMLAMRAHMSDSLEDQ
jgi:hypothetical protein